MVHLGSQGPDFVLVDVRVFLLDEQVSGVLIPAQVAQMQHCGATRVRMDLQAVACTLPKKGANNSLASFRPYQPTSHAIFGLLALPGGGTQGPREEVGLSQWPARLP